MLVRASVVAFPTRVSVAFGTVIVPVLLIFSVPEEFTRFVAVFPLSVLLVRMSVVALPTSVSVALGAVIVPVELKLKVPEEFTKLVAVFPLRVLFVSVSVVALPTRVSVAFGTVIVPVELWFSVPAPLMKLLAVFPLRVLLVRVWVAARTTRVSEASGKVKVLVVAVVIPEAWNLACLDVSPSSWTVRFVSRTVREFEFPRVLLKRDWEAASTTRVSDASGRVYVRVVAVDIPLAWNLACLVVSPSSWIVRFVSFTVTVEVLSSVLFETVTVFESFRIVPEVGKVAVLFCPVPPFAVGSTPVTAVVSEIFVRVFVEPLIDLFVSVSVEALPTRTSAAFICGSWISRSAE